MSFPINLIILDIATILPFVLLYFFKPKKLNSPFGYRTARSTANQENWDFAQQYSSRLFIFVPLLILPTQIILLLNQVSVNIIAAAALAQFIVYAVVVITFTETALKKFEEKSKS